jgi:D-alanine transaminase
MFIYLNGNFLPSETAKISPFDRGFLFADGVYEVIRTYNGNLFRFDDHLNRLHRSLTSIILEYDLANIKNITYQLTEKNNFTSSDCSIYIQITRGISVPRSHHFPNSLNPTIFISATKIIENLPEKTKGINVITCEDLRWQRCDIKSISLLPSVMVHQFANEKNAKEAILYKDEFITEGSHTNFFAVKNDTVYTAPEGNKILSGITRKVILELCKKLDIVVKEEFIKKDELQTFEEFFITSTTKEITPIVKIDSFTVPGNTPGNVTTKLQNEFRKLTMQY